MYSIALIDDENKVSQHIGPDIVGSDIKMMERYCRSARDAAIREILLGESQLSELDLAAMHLEADQYRVVICEKYSYNSQDASYRFSDLLRVTNQDNNSYDRVFLSGSEVLLLKGSFAIHKFDEFLERYNRETRPQKDSPLDSLFIAYGNCVPSLREVPASYDEVRGLLAHRFYCTEGQHTIGPETLPDQTGGHPDLTTEMLSDYLRHFLDYLQVFNRKAVAESLNELSEQLRTSAASVDNIKMFLTDLYLQIKEHMSHLYGSASIPFPGNSEIIRRIYESYYLYEILAYFTEQFEMIMSALGNSSRDSVLDDILHYINHNYTNNLTLEAIAQLFGYNSSYLGKIFTKKMGVNFNAYVDRIRIEHAKEMLAAEGTKIYLIAARVGYRNVDYFHIKFKKYVGMSPAEYRKQTRT